MIWDKGREHINELIEEGRLQIVPASSTAARHLIGSAGTHLTSARALAASDPQGAYALTYDAARKAFAAVLEAQGLRATSTGGHIVLYDAMMIQFDPPVGPPYSTLQLAQKEKKSDRIRLSHEFHPHTRRTDRSDHGSNDARQ